MLSELSLNTPSFVAGMFIGCASSGYISGHPDWWVWAIGAMICNFWIAWK